VAITLNETTALIKNSHLLARISAALAKAAEDVKNEQQDFTAVSATDTFTATGHSYADDDKIELFGESLPTGASKDTTYFIRDQATDTFKLADTKNGTAIVLTADGQGRVAVEHHTARFAWSSSVLLVRDGAMNEAIRSIWLVLQNTVIADGYNGSETGGSVDDADVQFVVNGLVNILAGVEV